MGGGRPRRATIVGFGMRAPKKARCSRMPAGVNVGVSMMDQVNLGYAGGPLTGFQVGCLIHAGVQGLSPGTKTGLDWEAEHDRAVELSKAD
jgi:hypothetical protein